MTNPSFEDYIAICNTKARYCRSVDEKDWAAYANVFTDDATLDLTEVGGAVLQGNRRIADGISQTVTAETKTAHQVHQPQITMVDAGTADVVWAMQDRVVWSPERAKEAGSSGIIGYGQYHERYVRGTDGEWRISQCRISRFHVDMVDATAQ